MIFWLSLFVGHIQNTIFETSYNQTMQRMILYIPLNDLNWLPWLIAFIAAASSLLLLVLFSVHRKNNLQRVIELEEKLHSHDALIYARTEAQLDKFKKGLQNHLAEINDRISSNEQHTHRLINQFDALKDALLSNIQVDTLHEDFNDDRNL